VRVMPRSRCAFRATPSKFSRSSAAPSPRTSSAASSCFRARSRARPDDDRITRHVRVGSNLGGSLGRATGSGRGRVLQRPDVLRPRWRPAQAGSGGWRSSWQQGSAHTDPGPTWSRRSEHRVRRLRPCPRCTSPAVRGRAAIVPCQRVWVYSRVPSMTARINTVLYWSDTR
jgi:hypothetical protein